MNYTYFFLKKECRTCRMLHPCLHSVMRGDRKILSSGILHGFTSYLLKEVFLFSILIGDDKHERGEMGEEKIHNCAGTA